MARGLLDTSVVIDLDDPAVIAAIPDEQSISCVTLGELHFGVLMAKPRQLPPRLQLLSRVESTFEPLPIDDAIARTWASLARETKRGGRNTRPRSNDLWIAATAMAYGVDLYTRDPDDLVAITNKVHVITI